MKNCHSKEELDCNKQYVFFSDPDNIAKGKIQQFPDHELEQKKNQNKLTGENPVNLGFDGGKENSNACLIPNTPNAFPFTFISAVKRKLVLDEKLETRKKVYESEKDKRGESNLYVSNTNPIVRQTISQSNKKMEFIKPLKVPDLKISPKTLDYYVGESSSLSEASVKKFDMLSIDNIQKERKTAKNSDKVQRKLDFSSSDVLLLHDDNDERIKTPDVLISSGLVKKKDYPRDNSRDKENRTKRIKKENSSSSKVDNSSYEVSKRFKNTKHISRKDVPELVLKNDIPMKSDLTLKKSKSKNFTTSTLKKEEDRRHRFSSAQYSKTSKDKFLELKGRSFSSESVSSSEKNAKLQDRVSVKDCYKDISSASSDRKNRDDNQLLISSKLEDQKNKVNPDNRYSKQQSRFSSHSQVRVLNMLPKEQIKRVPSKPKSVCSKADSIYSATSSDILEEIENATDSYTSFFKHQVASESSEMAFSASKNKEIEKQMQSPSHQSNQQNISNISKVETISSPSNVQNEESSIHSLMSDQAHGDTNAESKSFIDTSFSEMLLDPRRISFRDDSYSQQEEFSNLITPDMNLMLRSKRRKQLSQMNHKESDSKSLKIKSAENEGESIPSSHSTALQMKYQPELNLDSLKEPLCQVMDVESNLSNVNSEENAILYKEKSINQEINKQLVALRSGTEERVNKIESTSVDKALHDASTYFLDEKLSKGSKSSKKNSMVNQEDVVWQQKSARNSSDKMEDNSNRQPKSLVKVVEVQTQTANDIATQTDVNLHQSRMLRRLEELSGITYQRGPMATWDIPHLSLESLDPDKDFGQLDDISLSGKMRGMSEISLHETTSSIKTETGTEISISTRDVTCSFNKDLALEMAQLIQDEKQRYDKIQMLFKSREKTLNDRTKKLVKLEEQKRQLRDTGQDSRISSVKKKQRALLLKLQQEKDEMNRLKELHRIASQERKLMLQKQRDMFNPEMSTKNILTKLKRSADCHSPRRLSGPMKGYDIRSNSSMSSLVDSDKSQLERSQLDLKLQTSNISFQKSDKQYSRLDADGITTEKSDSEKLETINDKIDDTSSNFKGIEKPIYDIKSRKFEEKMPRADILRQIELHSKLKQGSLTGLSGQTEEGETVDLASTYPTESILNHGKSEPDTVIEEISRKSKFLQSDPDLILRAKTQQGLNSDIVAEELRLKKTLTSSKLNEDLQINSRCSKKAEKFSTIEKDGLKKFQNISGAKYTSKRKGTKSHKTKTCDVLMDNILRSKDDSQLWEEVIGHHNKRSKLDIEQSDENYQNSILEELDFNESQSSLRALLQHSKAVKDKNYQLLRDIAGDCEAEENIKTCETVDKNGRYLENFSEKKDKPGTNLGNVSTRSQVSTLTISHHSSGDSEKSYSRSVVIRSHDHRFKTSKKLEQILNAREAALASRRTCVEEWIAWHTRLREEENRVARMEQAAYKLVNAASKALSYHDTTVSSDASDVEGRIDVLAQKLADRRSEMARLKKEAKRQAKQRLRAMEANLINQIKKYDTTIYEMRKTLEARKGTTKNNEKVAIESKSVTDFKVPEIPIKRIHEIYQSSNLLQSRKDSDLNLTNRQENPIRNTQLFENLSNEDEMAEKSKLHETSESESHNSPSNNKSRERSTEFNDLTENCEKHFSMSKSKMISENDVFQSTVANDSPSINSSPSQNSIILESVLNKTNTQKSPTQLIVTLNSGRKSAENTISENLSMEEISDVHNTNCSKTDSVKEVVQSNCTQNSPLSFSKKLDFIGVNSKHLNDDISTLESDLKTLSEMMLQISKKSVNKSTHSKDYSEKRTSEDISEYLPSFKSVSPSNQFSSQHLSSKKDEITGDSDSINDVEGIVNDDNVKIDQDTKDVVIKKIDFKAKSKEMLNEIEKSIISDHIKSFEIESHFANETFEEGMRNLHKESEVLSNDLTSLEGDIKSISKMISKAAQNKNTPEYFSDLTSRSNILTEASMSCENFASKSSKKCISPVTSEMQVSSEIIDDLEGSTNNVSNEKVDFEKFETVPQMIVSIMEKPTSSTDDNLCKNVIQNTAQEEKVVDENSTTSEQQADETLGQPFFKPTNESNFSNTSQEEEKVASSYDSSLDEAKKYVEKSLSPDNIPTDEDWTISDSFEFHNKEKTSTSPMEENYSPLKVTVSEDKQLNEHFSTTKEILDFENELHVEFGNIENNSTPISSTKFTDNKTNLKSIVLDDSLNLNECDIFVNGEQQQLTRVQTDNDNKIDENNENVLKETRNNEDQFESINCEDLSNTVKKDVLSPIISRNSIDESTSVLHDHQSKENISIGLNKPTSSINTLSEDTDMQEESPQKIIVPGTEIPDELKTESLDDSGLCEIGLKPKVTFPDDSGTEKEENASKENILMSDAEINEWSESSEEQESSGDEQLDNLVEIVEDKLETLEVSDANLSYALQKLGNVKGFSVVRDPQYEDISEENLEISVILDKIESNRPQKTTMVPDKYEAEIVVQILDDILFKSVLKTDKLSLDFNIESQEQLSEEKNQIQEPEEKEGKDIERPEIALNDFYNNKEHETDVSSESGEGYAQRDVSEIEAASPTDVNDSRLEIDALNDDLLSSISIHPNLESKADFQVTPIVTNAEKEIMAMIDKLKASLKQPGLEVAELDATLLRIEQLQIELEIKKLEAEEVSYYVREIPNKPPPPYTPPGSGRLSTSQSSPSPPPAVIPTNVDDLTAFTEKATSLIFQAKESGKDIMSLEPPSEIWDLRKDNEILKKDRRIYHSFLFDLCKETIAEVYRMEYGRPGPSWTRPNVKTKPAIKIPKNIEELTEYVNKEVATLFGFKTKLQRENMVMRWSRKRRDRVDELLAREAQAEEEEWTKFHCDELAVKNELTIAILDSLILETVNVVNTAFTKKRKFKV